MESIRIPLNHDVRACFNAILGFQEILLEDLNHLDKDSKHMLERIKVRSQEGLDILSDLSEKFKTI